MIYRRRTNPNVNREDVQGFLHKTGTIVERRAPVQLRRWHPELLLRIYPHGVYPQEPLIVDEHGRGAIGRDLDDFLSVCAAHVDVSLCVNRRAACKFGQYMHVLKSESSAALPVEGVSAYGSVY